MAYETEAIARLLRDDDPETVRLVKAQLIQSGADSIEKLRLLTESSDRCVASHARDVLLELEVQDAENDFLLHCHFCGEQFDLEQSIWLLSRALLPGVETAPLEQKITQWGRQFLMRVSRCISDRERVLELTRFMAGELGFRGNTQDYYSARNSLLPCVVESRMGIPILLTLLYRMIAGRAGMVVEGINLPGHFIARHGEVLFDPFHRGKILSLSDCREILNRQQLPFKGAFLIPATDRQILLRVLANLLYVYDLKNECHQHKRVHAWIQALSKDR